MTTLAAAALLARLNHPTRRGAPTMKPFVQDAYGPTDVLAYTDVDVPVVGAGDVLVRVRAVALHPGDNFILTGTPYIVRLAFGLRRPRHGIPGRDTAGTVEAVGRDVRGLAPGDEVFGWSATGTLDNVEAQPLSDTRRALTSEGTLIPNSGEGGRWIGPLGRIAKARISSLVTRQRLRPFTSRENHHHLLELAHLADAGELIPVIDRTYPLHRAPDAFEHLATRHARGKVIITV